MAAKTGRSRRSSAPLGSGWRALSQPYESTATGSFSPIVVRRSVSSDSFASCVATRLAHAAAAATRAAVADAAAAASV